jgi:DNA-directed RNA polymerase subunit RPC12/RpoP
MLHEVTKPSKEKVMNKIKCPHCNHKYTDDDMYKSKTDLWAICPKEELIEEECVLCGETFWIQGGYKPTYEIYKTEEEVL